ncbi:hypothetical protein AHAS_Ahas08G0079800 [Arachis hypogaea]
MLDGGQQMNMNVPIPINRFGFYSLIGSDNGNASKHCRHAVSLYSFGYLIDGIEYRIIHIYKHAYSTKQMSWTCYNSFEADWNHSDKFNTKVQKLGPKYVVNNEIVYWIG